MPEVLKVKSMFPSGAEFTAPVRPVNDCSCTDSVAHTLLTVGVYVPVREQFENRSAKQKQESRDIAPWKPSAQHAPKPKTNRKAAQQHRVTEQQYSSPAVHIDRQDGGDPCCSG